MKMNKFGKVILAASIALGGLGVSQLSNPSKASAATGTVGQCSATVWTDATNYYSGATTVDYKVTKPSTSCGYVYYKASVYQVGDGASPTGLNQIGSFSYNTGIRSFSTSSIKAAKPYSGNRFRIVVAFYKYADYTGYIGETRSADFFVY